MIPDYRLATEIPEKALGRALGVGLAAETVVGEWKRWG